MTAPDELEMINRRKVLAALASTGAVSVAGCSDGSDGESSGTDTPSDGGDTTATPSPTVKETDTPTPIPDDVEPRDSEFNWAFKSSWNPIEANLNPESADANNPWFVQNIWGAMGVQANLRGEPLYLQAESFELGEDNRSATVTYGDWEWWDGTPLRAKDITASTKIFNFQTYYQEESPEGPVEVIQEEPPVIRHNFQCQRNPQLALLDQRFSLTWPQYEWYEEWLEQYRDATTESEINSITQELQKESITMQDVVDNEYGIGMWKPTDWNTQRVVHEKWGDHKWADKTNLERFTLDLVESNQKITQAVANGRVDGGDVGQISGAGIQNDSYDIVHKVPTGAQIGLKLNKSNKHLNRPRVRRAMAHVINHDDILQALKQGLGVNAAYPGTQNMASKQIENNYLSESVRSNMIDYGRGAQTEKATQLMNEAGYSKQGGVWTDGEGDSIQLTHITPSWNKYKFISDYLSDKLGNFGIQTDVQPLSYSGFQNIWQNTFDFDIATWFQQGLHPALWYGLGRNGKSWQELNGWGLSVLANPDKNVGCDPVEREIQEGMKRDPRLGQPIRPEYPADVGTESLDLDSVGETKTLKPFVLNTQLQQALSKEDLMAATKEFAWYANWAVPNLELFDEVFTHFGKSQDFQFPQNSQSSYYQRDMWLWMKEGRINGKAAE